MRGIRRNLQYSYLGLSEDEQRKSGYGDHGFSVGVSMEPVPESHHDIGHGMGHGLQVTENGPSDIVSGSPFRPSFLKSAGTEKAPGGDEFNAALKPARSFDSLIGNSGTMVSSSSSGLMCSQRIAVSTKYTEALQFCTEGLGFESSDETDSTASSPRIEAYKTEKLSTDDEEHFDGGAEVNNKDNGHAGCCKNLITSRAPRAAIKNIKNFPPPIKNFPPPLPSIARNGQPCMMMKSYKRDGRFILQEFKVPSHEVLHAWRGEGRLKLQLVQQQEEQKDDTVFKCINPGSSDNNIYSKNSGETIDSDPPKEESGTICEK